MAYCEKCGNQVNETASFCSACGAKRNVGGTQVPQQTYVNNTYQYQPPTPEVLIRKVRDKIKIEAIVWVVIASIQAIVGLGYLLYDIDCISCRDASQWITAFSLLGVSVLNFLVCKKDFEYEKQIAIAPVGIVEKYKPIGGYIGTLIYNLIFGGVIGVVGSIFCFVTRSYVMQNEQQFMELENSYKAQHSINN